MFSKIHTLPTTAQVKKVDGVIALALIAVYAALMAVTLSILPLDGRYIYRQLALESLWLLCFTPLLVIRKQKASSIGLNCCPIPYLTIAAFTVAAGIVAYRRQDFDIFGRWLFYLIAVAATEEIIFRGFAFPRVARLTGSAWWSLLITGMLFGAMHHISQMIWYGAPWHGVFSHLLGTGVLGSLVFLLVYAYTGSLANAILLHAALDYQAYIPAFLYITIAYIAVVILAPRAYRYIKEKA